jgi:hypothetical protein
MRKKFLTIRSKIQIAITEKSTDTSSSVEHQQSSISAQPSRSETSGSHGSNQGCGVGVRVVESEGILGGVGVGKNVLTPTPTSI